MRTQEDEDLSGFLALTNGSKPFQATLKTNISIKPVIFLPVSHLCLSVTQKSWKESLSYYSSGEIIFPPWLTDSPQPATHLSLGICNGYNHKSACIALLCGDGVTFRMQPFGLSEDILAKPKEMKYSWLTLQSCHLQGRSNQRQWQTAPEPRNTKHGTSVVLLILTTPAIRWQVGIAEMSEEFSGFQCRHLNRQQGVLGTLATGHYGHYHHLIMRLDQTASKRRSTFQLENLQLFNGQWWPPLKGSHKQKV